MLGALIMHNDAYAKVADILTPECFTELIHQKMFNVAVAMLGQGKPLNPITMETYLGTVEIAEGMTVTDYVIHTAAQSCLPMEIKDYAQMLHDLAVRRKMVKVAEDTLLAAFDAPPEMTARHLVDQAVDSLSELRHDGGEIREFESFSGASERAIMQANQAYQSGGQLVGLSTGLYKLDDALGGLQPTDLIILAGRPGMGKTSLATNIAYNIAASFKAKMAMGERPGIVGFSSLEMSGEQLAQRIIGERSGVPGWKVRRGKASEDEMMRYIEAQRELRDLPLFIDATGDISIHTLRTRVRAMKKKRRIAVLLVDYLQLLHGSKQGREHNRVQEVTEITTGLKAMAKELQIPVIALSQLSRKVEERPDRRPQLSDLRESGSIEQDADCVMFVFREEYYLNKDKEPPAGTEDHFEFMKRKRAAKGVAEIIIAKNRHGPEATLRLGFDSSLTTFTDEPAVDEEEEVAPAEPKPKKKLSLTADASILYGVLKGFSISRSIAPHKEMMDADRRISRTARLVKYEEARDQYGMEVYGPDADPDMVDKKCREAIKQLRKYEIANWCGSKELGGFLWLPEMTD